MDLFLIDLKTREKFSKMSHKGQNCTTVRFSVCLLNCKEESSDSWLDRKYVSAIFVLLQVVENLEKTSSVVDIVGPLGSAGSSGRKTNSNSQEALFSPTHGILLSGAAIPYKTLELSALAGI